MPPITCYNTTMHWKPTTLKLFDLLCCKHHVTQELAAMGKHGEIYLYGEGVAGVVVWGVGAAKKIKKLAGLRGGGSIVKGEEAIFRLPQILVNQAASIIKVKKNRISMARMLNERKGS